MQPYRVSDKRAFSKSPEYEAREFFGVPPNATIDELAAIAGLYPVFRIIDIETATNEIEKVKKVLRRDPSALDRAAEAVAQALVRWDGKDAPMSAHLVTARTFVAT